MQSRPKGSRKQEKEGNGNPEGNQVRKRKANLSLRSCRTLLPDKGRRQHGCLPNPYSDVHMVPTCSCPSAGVQCPACWPFSQSSGLELLSSRMKADRPPQVLTVLQGALPDSSACRGLCQRQNPASHWLLIPSVRACQEKRQLLATCQHILHCLKYCVPTTCPVWYETNLPEEMNRILLLKFLRQVH